jgi:hypothetical protein
MNKKLEHVFDASSNQQTYAKKGTGGRSTHDTVDKLQTLKIGTSFDQLQMQT